MDQRAIAIRRGQWFSIGRELSKAMPDSKRDRRGGLLGNLMIVLHLRNWMFFHLLLIILHLGS